MRRLSALILPVVAGLALAACSAGSAPGWTYAPAASASAAPSGAASGSPSTSAAPSATVSAAPSAEASAPASAETSAAPSGGGVTLTITAPSGAATNGYKETTLQATAGTPFTIHFDNQDNQAPHNVQLKAPDGTPVVLGGDTAFFTGPGTRDYQVPALTAGTYDYSCAVHPSTMKGTLTVN
jgi:plastocyanin